MLVSDRCAWKGQTGIIAHEQTFGRKSISIDGTERVNGMASYDREAAKNIHLYAWVWCDVLR